MTGPEKPETKATTADGGLGKVSVENGKSTRKRDLAGRVGDKGRKAGWTWAKKGREVTYVWHKPLALAVRTAYVLHGSG